MTFQYFLPFHRLPPHFGHLTIAMGCPLFLISAHLCLLCLLSSTHQTKLVFLPSLASYTPDLGPFPVQKEELTQALPIFWSSSCFNGGGGKQGFLEQNTIHTSAHHCPGRAWAVLWTPWCSLPGIAHIQHSRVLIPVKWVNAGTVVSWTVLLLCSLKQLKHHRLFSWVSAPGRVTLVRLGPHQPWFPVVIYMWRLI